ncbi:HesA/MoeB/ThiF family protein [Sphingomonas bacterium]|uniref:HesA/MoeB/ThiF family protein n=1 Tax=Sphingomonas bacterium TaxID=1895847 RepID=UPI001576C739|nr:ThiF family adenylyltransferase [Sphingomonas bacterium]
MTGLRFAAPGYATLHEALLRETDRETCAAAFTHANPKHGAWVVAEPGVELVPESAYERRDAVSAVLRPAYLVNLANRARAQGLGLVLAHTHPRCDRAPVFSPIDDAGEAEIKAYLDRRAPDSAPLALVVGPNGCRCRQLGATTELPVWEIGETVRLVSDAGAAAGASVHDRQIRAFGAIGQAILGKLHVAVIGAGGTGSVVVQQLAHLGVSALTVIDPDTVEQTNLNRLVGAGQGDVGVPKVEVARRSVLAVNPDAHVQAVTGDVVDYDVAQRLAGFDFVFLCTDSHASRAVVGQAAYQHLVPTIDMGVSITIGAAGVEHVTGRVQMLTPGASCLSCTRALDGEQIRREMMTPEQRAADPYVQGLHEPQPAVISLNSTMASLAITMFLGAVTPVPAQARFQLYDGVRGTIRPTVARANPTCIVCSREGALAKGASWPLPVRPPEARDGR